MYILASRFNGTLYVSVTSNLIGGLLQHRGRLLKGFTLRYGNYRLVWFEMADTMESGDRDREAPREMAALV